MKQAEVDRKKAEAKLDKDVERVAGRVVEPGEIPAESVTITQGGITKAIYIPTEKGREFHAAGQPYVLCSGGRNSGKSHILRWDAHLRNLLVPGHKALLLRRTFPQLRGSHFDRAEVEAKLLGCAKPFNRTHYFIEYPNGSKLQFGHCESDAAILDYLSQEWDWIGFDELTTFTFDQFIRISGSARTTAGSGRQAYVRAATNPIGEGASWVKRYFIDKSVSEEENPEYKPSEWRNIIANLADNPHANREDYERRLLMLPSESLRRAYMFGEWLVEGQFFSEWRERKDGTEWHVVPEMPRFSGVPINLVPWIEVTRVIDWGYSEAEPGYCAWVAHLPDGSALVIKEWVFTQRIPEAAGAIINQKSEGLKIRRTIGDPMMFHERTGKSIAYLMNVEGKVPMYPADNDRENGWVALHTWLVSTRNDGLGPRPLLQFLAPQLNGFGAPYAIRTLPSLQVDPKKPSDTSQGLGVEDHAADALRYWASNWPNPSRVPPPTNTWPKEVRQAMLGGGDQGDVLGSESVQR